MEGTAYCAGLRCVTTLCSESSAIFEPLTLLLFPVCTLNVPATTIKPCNNQFSVLGCCTAVLPASEL